MDFVEKKQRVVDAFNKKITEEITKEEFLEIIQEFSNDGELTGVELFNSIFQELLVSFDELSRKDLKQRKLMIESYMY
ncbi:MAG: hypothetical protein ACLFPL_04340 [Candidatus Nanoarchaeia archaeon]